MMYICITFDYELFFGKNNGSYDDVLFQPTYPLIDALEKKDISATFFADVCSIPIASKYSQMSYVEGFTKQIQYMKQHGQDVQLHIHPHWYNSIWNGEEWIFSNLGYRLHDYIEDKEINHIISEGIGFLNDTLLSVDKNYECIAFRAGGFSIQPHEEVVSALYDNGIRVDSSVAPQLHVNSDAHFYDFRHDLDKLNWSISNMAKWWEDSTKEKHILEIPIATINKSPFTFVLRRIFASETIKLNAGPKRGSYITSHNKSKGKMMSFYNYVTGYNAISMDAYTAEFLYEQTKRFYKKNKCDDQVVAIIGHPKLVTEKYIDNLCRYIDLINQDDRFEFISIYDAYKKKQAL